MLDYLYLLLIPEDAVYDDDRIRVKAKGQTLGVLRETETHIYYDVIEDTGRISGKGAATKENVAHRLRQKDWDITTLGCSSRDKEAA